MKLTSKQKKFVEFYNGNATEAAIKAGYSKKTAKAIANENLTKPYLLQAIKQRQDKETNTGIMNRQERQKFWSDIANDIKQEINARLRASELLAKSEADFTVNINNNVIQTPTITFSIVKK